MNLGLKLIVVSALALSWAGCASLDHSSAREDEAGPASRQATTRTQHGEEIGETGPGRDYEEQRVHAAMRGLEYESGRVQVDKAEAAQLVAHPNAGTAPSLRDIGVRELEQHNDPIAAIKALTLAVINDPTDARSYEALGRALMFEGESREAEAAFRTALDLDPALTAAGFQLGALLQMTGRNSQAIDQWLKVVAIEPNFGQAHSRLATELYYAGRYGESWKHVHEAQRCGAIVPPQFLPLLEAQWPEPARP